jgi:dipeptidyl-peptidase-4
MTSLTSSLRVIALLFLLGATTSALAQGTRCDYERASKLRGLVRNRVFKTEVRPHWLADGSRFWYRNDLPGGAREFVLVDAPQGKRRPAFDHARLAESLSAATGQQYAATHLPLEAIDFDPSGDAVYFRAAERSWKCDLKTYALSEAEPPKTPEKEARPDTAARPRRRSRPGSERSPDGKWVTFVKDHNLYLRAQGTGEEFALSRDGRPEDAYQAGVYWSPDSLKLVALRTKDGDHRKVYVIESSPRDQLQPKLHSYEYLKPGDRIPITKPHLFDVARRKEIPVSDELFSNPWSISRIHWCPDSRRFMFLYNQRGHQVLRIVAVDAQTGEAGAIIDEQSKTFIDYSFKEFTRYLDQTHEIIWMSERDGWNHLYLYDSRTGEVKNQITRGSWVVRGVDRVDEENRQIWFRAGGIYPEQDPYYVHYCRINFDGTGLVILTDGNGTHAIEYSPDRRFLIDTYSRVDMPPVTELRRVDDGKLVCPLETADAGALLATGWRMPERFVAKGRDGKTDIYGVIYRPTTFDPRKKYPVIEAIYAGPQGSFVPKQFRPFHEPQAMAELGFILVQIDGMGTSNRSKAFHDVCWKNLADSGFPDRIPWIKAAAKKYPYMDLARVGIYGGSAGGQSSMRALLDHGDFYKVAVSDSGCHDNRMDKIWWNEAWMGWPVGPQYAENSNVTAAHKLQGKLLLIVGELDRNVDPASTMQVVNALIKADKDFDLLVVPGAGHGIGGPYGVRRRQDYFVRHLLGVEPRSQP